MWELRWHPFRAEWVLFTSHRGARPWIGEVVSDDEPAADPRNALAPLGQRIGTTNPDYRGVYWFTNDLPVFGPDAPEPAASDELYRTRRAIGSAEVVCYHHDPATTLPDLTDDEVTAVVTTLRDRTAALQALDGVAHVLVFENRGAAVGTSNPHPHCQLYAGALVYGTMAREAEVAAEHHRLTGRSILADVVERELAGPRVLDENDRFFACVPWFARYAYETVILPRRPVTSLVDLALDHDDRLTIGPLSLLPSEIADMAREPYTQIREMLATAPKWTRYPLGVVLVLVRHGEIDPPTGRVAISSDVPISAGVSSSAALEVATARALGAVCDPLRLATLCQEAENHVVGAPCGIMDQVTVAMGREGAVLPILCRPAEVAEPVALPDGTEVVGWPTGATHDVAGSPYARARAAAFMGKRIAETHVGHRWDWVSETASDLLLTLPEEMSGAEFLDRWHRTDDPLTTIDPAASYPVRAATAFGAGEHLRNMAALAHLRAGAVDSIGELMAASHAGYDSMGLGHPAATDVVAEALATPGVLGARSSGGGCGGTIVVLCRTGSLDHVAGLIR